MDLKGIKGNSGEIYVEANRCNNKHATLMWKTGQVKRLCIDLQEIIKLKVSRDKKDFEKNIKKLEKDFNSYLKVSLVGLIEEAKEIVPRMYDYKDQLETDTESVETKKLI